MNKKTMREGQEFQTVIKPKRSLFEFNLKEVWNYTEECTHFDYMELSKIQEKS